MDSILDSLLHGCIELQLGEADFLARLPSRLGSKIDPVVEDLGGSVHTDLHGLVLSR